MKKKTILSSLLASIMFIASIGLTGCNLFGNDDEEDTHNGDKNPTADVVGTLYVDTTFTVPEFSITLNGVTINKENMANKPVYRCTVTTTNTYNTTETFTFYGYKLVDCCEVAGVTYRGLVTYVATDSYSSTWNGGVNDKTMLALQKGTDQSFAPYFAPLDSVNTPDYGKLIASITIAESLNTQPTQDPTTPADAEWKANTSIDVSSWASITFTLNGQQCTVGSLSSLTVYKVTVQTEKDGTITTAKYTGYLLSDVLTLKEIAAGTISAAASNRTKTFAASKLEGQVMLLGIELDKAVATDGSVWVCDTSSHKKGDMFSGVVSITIGETNNQ